MPIDPIGFRANRLLTALPAAERERLLTNSESVELIFSQELYRAWNPITHVYFPTGSYISILTPNNADMGLEVGLIGTEGMLGITVILGIDIAPFEARVQGAGSALRIDAAWFQHELEHYPALRTALKRYLFTMVNQLAQSVACNRFHFVEARLARWLLMTHDRAHADTFHATHIFLAYILGVRRVGITKAANSLQQQKLISYRRGELTILNRTGLEAVACECYQIDRANYKRILG